MPLPDGYVVPKRQMQEFELFDEGLYDVKIDKIVLKKDVPAFNNPEEKYDALTFHFKVLSEGAFKDHIMFKPSVRILMAAGWEGGSPSTLYSIYCAANGVKLSDDDAQLITAGEINALEGKTLQVLIENKPNSKGVISSKITKFLASKATNAAIAAQAPQTTAAPAQGQMDFGQQLEEEAAANVAAAPPSTDGDINVEDIPF